MKKYFLVLIGMASNMLLYAQDAYDAWKFAQQDIYGTARYIGLSGAFAALGGDPSAVKDNPAALGVFRQTDVSITLDLNWERTKSNWDRGDLYTARAFRLSCGQVNWVQNFKTGEVDNGLITHSLMIGYHRLKNFDRELLSGAQSNAVSLTDYMANFSNGITASQMGDDSFYNISVPWLTIMGYEGYILNPDSLNPGTWHSILSENEHVAAGFKLSETGWMDEYNLGWGANVSNRLYFGLSLALRTMRYTKNVIYSEVFAQGGEFELESRYSVKGIGFNAVAGFIYRPIDPLRLALSVQSPTLMNYKESNSAVLRSWGVSQSDNRVVSPVSDYYNYRLTAPWRVTAGLAVTMSDKALVSVQFDYEFFRAMRFSANTGNANAWQMENQSIRNQLGNALSPRVGLEWFVTNNFALRLGYAFKTYINTGNYERYLADNTTRTDTEFGGIKRQHYVGAGMGFRNHIVIADIAYQYRINNESICPFNGADPIDFDATSHRIVFTIGIK